MKNIFWIPIVLISYLSLSSQSLGKEVNYFNKHDQVLSSEREYRVTEGKSLYCKYNGDKIIFKYEEEYSDSLVLSWKTERIGNKDCNFCINSYHIAVTDSSIVCKQRDKEKTIKKPRDMPTSDIKAYFRELNIKEFLSYKKLPSIAMLDFDVKEKFYFKNDKLMYKDHYENGEKKNTVCYHYNNNCISALQVNQKTGLLELENTISWNQNKTIVVMSNKEFMDGFVKSIKSDTIVYWDDRFGKNQNLYELDFNAALNKARYFKEHLENLYAANRQNDLISVSEYLKNIQSDLGDYAHLKIEKETIDNQTSISILDSRTNDLLQRIQIIEHSQPSHSFVLY